MNPVTRREFIGTLSALAAPGLASETPPGAEVNLLAMGDWGAPRRTNDPDDAATLKNFQDRVAAAMADYATKSAAKGSPISAVLPLGDNFYADFKEDGLQGPDDARFKTRFEDLYPKPALDVPFYFAIGNHDYEDGDRQSWKHQIAYARREPVGRWQFPADKDATWYRKDFALADGRFSMLVLDTNTDHVKNAWKDQIQWLEKQLEETKNSRWRIVVAHHPMFTDGYHFDGAKDPGLYPKIRQTILPKLKDVVFYVSAHDHNQQHIHDHPGHPHLDFLLSGAGGGDFLKDRKASNRPYKNTFIKKLGFLHLRFTIKEASAQFISVDKSTGTWNVEHTVTRA